MTASYPVSLDVDGRACLVVGRRSRGGPQGPGPPALWRQVTVIAPEVCEAMATLAPLTIERRPYAAGEAGSYRLVVTATGIPAVDGAVFADAEAAGVWVNSADDSAHCSFILPAVHRDGAVTIAVSTGGQSPALSSWLRTRLAAECGSGVGRTGRPPGPGAPTHCTTPVAATEIGGLGRPPRRPAARARPRGPAARGAGTRGGGHRYRSHGVGRGGRPDRSHLGLLHLRLRHHEHRAEHQQHERRSGGEHHRPGVAPDLLVHRNPAVAQGDAERPGAHARPARARLRRAGP